MDRESIIGLQKIDCNCNDCVFMSRDFARFEESLALHLRWQQDYFNNVSLNMLRRADWWESERNSSRNKEKAESLRAEVKKRKFQFNRNEVTINYGFCSLYKKTVSFIPNTLQLETQHCFKHRRDDA